MGQALGWYTLSQCMSCPYIPERGWKCDMGLFPERGGNAYRVKKNCSPPQSTFLVSKIFAKEAEEWANLC